jgi:hypothetical protein
VKTASLTAVALDGLDRASARLADRARDIAVPADRVSLESTVVGALGDVASYRANLRTLRTANDLDETVLGLLAAARAVG